MAHRDYIRNFTAETAISARRIVAMGATDGAVKLATASTDPIIGVSDEITVSAGERIDVVLSGSAEVVCGGAVTRGAQITSDATGKAVVGTGRVVGIALQAGAAGDVIDILLAQGKA